MVTINHNMNNFMIENDDGLPLNICNECVNNVNHCYDFINTCKKTDHILRELLNNDENLNKSNQSAVKEESSVKVEEFEDNQFYNDDSYSSPEPCTKHENDFLHDIEIEITPDINTHKSKSGSNRKRKIIKTKFKDDDTKSHNKVKNAKKKNYTCPVCDNIFIGKTLFRCHMADEHPSFKKFVCNYCPKAFSKSQYLKQHLITHTSKRSFSCTVCPKKFKQQCQLIQHQKSHSDEKPYKCNKCDMSFHQRNGMISHSKQHDDIVQHLCHLCGQGFAQLGNLMVHMRVHTGEKPYACSSCTFRCSVQSGMRRHERTHINLRPHICSFCEKAFNNSGSLTRHERIHTGELPYRCTLCPHAFIDSWKRKNHLIKSHNMSLKDIPRMFPGRKKVYVNKTSNDSSYIKSEPS